MIECLGLQVRSGHDLPVLEPGQECAGVRDQAVRGCQAHADAQPPTSRPHHRVSQMERIRYENNRNNKSCFFPAGAFDIKQFSYNKLLKDLLYF